MRGKESVVPVFRLDRWTTNTVVVLTVLTAWVVLAGSVHAQNIQQGQQEAERLFAAAAVAERRGDFVEAELRYQECLELAQRHRLPNMEAAVLHRLAVIRARSNRFTESANMFRRAIELDPRNASILNDYAQLYAGRRNLAEAEVILKNALSIDPNNQRVLFNLGMVIAQRGARQIEGLRYLKLAVGDADAYRELARIYRTMGDVSRAEFAEQKAQLADARRPEGQQQAPGMLAAAPGDNGAIRPSQELVHQPPVHQPQTPPEIVNRVRQELVELEMREIAEMQRNALDTTSSPSVAHMSFTPIPSSMPTPMGSATPERMQAAPSGTIAGSPDGASPHGDTRTGDANQRRVFPIVSPIAPPIASPGPIAQSAPPQSPSSQSPPPHVVVAATPQTPSLHTSSPHTSSPHTSSSQTSPPADPFATAVRQQSPPSASATSASAPSAALASSSAPVRRLEPPPTDTAPVRTAVRVLPNRSEPLSATPSPDQSRGAGTPVPSATGSRATENRMESRAIESRTESRTESRATESGTRSNEREVPSLILISPTSLSGRGTQSERGAGQGLPRHISLPSGQTLPGDDGRAERATANNPLRQIQAERADWIDPSADTSLIAALPPHSALGIRRISRADQNDLPPSQLPSQLDSVSNATSPQPGRIVALRTVEATEGTERNNASGNNASGNNAERNNASGNNTSGDGIAGHLAVRDVDVLQPPSAVFARQEVPVAQFAPPEHAFVATRLHSEPPPAQTAPASTQGLGHTRGFQNDRQFSTATTPGVLAFAPIQRNAPPAVAADRSVAPDRSVAMERSVPAEPPVEVAARPLEPSTLSPGVFAPDVFAPGIFAPGVLMSNASSSDTFASDTLASSAPASSALSHGQLPQTHGQLPQALADDSESPKVAATSVPPALPPVAAVVPFPLLDEQPRPADPFPVASLPPRTAEVSPLPALVPLAPQPAESFPVANVPPRLTETRLAPSPLPVSAPPAVEPAESFPVANVPPRLTETRPAPSPMPTSAPVAPPAPQPAEAFAIASAPPRSAEATAMPPSPSSSPLAPPPPSSLSALTPLAVDSADPFPMASNLSSDLPRLAEARAPFASAAPTSMPTSEPAIRAPVQGEAAGFASSRRGVQEVRVQEVRVPEVPVQGINVPNDEEASGFARSRR